MADEVILFDASGNRVHRLNRAASYIWQFCDGQSSPRDIADRLAATYGIATEAVLNDVDTTLAEFKRLGLLADVSG